ncbi:Tfp pilus assembly protein PilN [Methylophilaceae bacterium 11]|jgi:type IV pilus assembly protein PilN|uniref:PilN domain-containing protein n=1 Tax=unclassified Methylotenera TaxID=2643294 RepID=UPI000380D7B7|nr:MULTISPECIES: PilN domain-containing protein [unclassified Methylotenera]EUJ11557.1 Tfp pilus assembly protein PilN [Methylophilaceae bacterium 11]
MVRINLLPHRQVKRAEKQRQFGLMALGTVVLASALVFMGWSVINARKDAQDDRNRRLDDAIVKLDSEIKDIKALKDQINSVLERKQIVENLQTNRSQAVVVLDEVARQLPEGVFIRSIKQQGSAIEIQGSADTNARVATLVRNLTASTWMESPSLVEIKAVTVNNLKQNEFTLNVNLRAPQVDAEKDAQAKKQGANP